MGGSQVESRHVRLKTTLNTGLFDYLFQLFPCSVNITYIGKDGNKYPVKGKVGDNALYLAHRFGIDMEGTLHGFCVAITIDLIIEFFLF